MPDAWVARIFDKLSLTYGAAWVRKWEGVDGAAVRADWGHELRGFQQSPHAIKHALEHLPPSEPPTVLQFRDLCLKAPQFAPKALPSPPADPAAVARARESVRGIGRRMDRQWPMNLRDREQRGDRLTAAQREMWREALRAPRGGDEAAELDAAKLAEAKRVAQQKVDDYMAAGHSPRSCNG